VEPVRRHEQLAPKAGAVYLSGSHGNRQKPVPGRMCTDTLLPSISSHLLRNEISSNGKHAAELEDQEAAF